MFGALILCIIPRIVECGIYSGVWGSSWCISTHLHALMLSPSYLSVLLNVCVRMSCVIQNSHALTWFISSNLRKCYLMIFEESLKTELTSASSKTPMQCTWLHLETTMPYRPWRYAEKLKWPDTTDWTLAAGTLPDLGEDSAAGIHGVALMSWNTGGCFLQAGEVYWRGRHGDRDWKAAELLYADLFCLPAMVVGGLVWQFLRWELTLRSVM